MNAIELIFGAIAAALGAASLLAEKSLPVDLRAGRGLSATLLILGLLLIYDGLPTQQTPDVMTYSRYEFTVEYPTDGAPVARLMYEPFNPNPVLEVDRVITRVGETELVVDGDDVTLYLPQ